MKKAGSRLLLVALVLVLTLCPVMASAQGAAEAASCVVSREALTQRGVQIVENANRQIEACVALARWQARFSQADWQLDCIIDALVVGTNAIAQSAILRASLYGVAAVCEYVPVEVGGRIVLIDPLKVIRV